MENWDVLMDQEMAKPYMADLKERLDEAYSAGKVYPAKENLFRALEQTPFDQVKVVILGQDPYHGAGQAQGFSFSVPANMKIPPSLQNIYKELEQEYGCRIKRSGDLSDWADQGVLLLNAILSVEEGKPLSHAGFGWQQFTDAVIDALNASDQPIVFMLWGAQARKAKARLTNPNHLILESAHPSPLSVNRGFFGSNQFVKANEFLESHGVSGIDWTASNKE